MPPNGNGTVLSALALVGQVGIIIAACVLGGVLAGRELDRVLGTAPVLMLVLAAAGVAAGMAAVYHLVMKSLTTGGRNMRRPPS